MCNDVIIPFKENIKPLGHNKKQKLLHLPQIKPKICPALKQSKPKNPKLALN